MLNNFSRRRGRNQAGEHALGQQVPNSGMRQILTDAVAEDSVESDTIVKERLYQAYRRFCESHKLAIFSKEILGKILKKRYQEGRESSGKRETVWRGIKLKEEYNIDLGQETLDVPQ
jgi:hypothetical protein